MFMIINKTTGKPLRLSYDMETLGSDYMNYERPSFTVEDENQYNTDCVIFMAPTKEACEAVLSAPPRHRRDVSEITKPELIQGYIDGEQAEYIVKAVV